MAWRFPWWRWTPPESTILGEHDNAVASFHAIFQRANFPETVISTARKPLRRSSNVLRSPTRFLSASVKRSSHVKWVGSLRLMMDGSIGEARGPRYVALGAQAVPFLHPEFKLTVEFPREMPPLNAMTVASREPDADRLEVGKRDEVRFHHEAPGCLAGGMVVRISGRVDPLENSNRKWRSFRLGSVFGCASTRQCDRCRWRSRIDCLEILRALGVAGAVTLLLFRRHLWRLGLHRVAHEEPAPDLPPDAHSRLAWPARALAVYRLDPLLPKAVQSRILGSGPNLVGRMSE
jgi:hypothetical protein